MPLLAEPAPGLLGPARRAIPLVRPYFPPAAALHRLLEQVRSSGQVTNGGPLHARLERELALALGWPSPVLTSSGTSALQLALTALGVTGEVVVPAFTFPATAQAVLRAGAVPVLADVGADGITLDPAAAEAAVTARTSAIVPVHAFGFPADVAGLQAVADRHGLALVYDAAQAVAVRVDGADVSRFGDACAFSLHATKVLHTVEGGCVVAKSPPVADRVAALRNFGLLPHGPADAGGTNAKLSEVHAAFGLLGLQRLAEHVRARRRLFERYCEQLAGLAQVTVLRPRPGVEWNYAYLVVDVDPAGGVCAATLAGVLHNHGVDARRYFDGRYLVSGVRAGTPTARAAASRRRVLCLPLWPGLGELDLDRVCEGVRHACWSATASRQP